MKKRRVNISKPPKLIDALGTLGSILKEEEMENRDAVHIAVLPVTAQYPLSAGQHVGFVDEEKLVVDVSAKKLIGIADPFLPRRVQAGEHFYMFLYPRTITALQHHWQHPDVPDVGVLAEAGQQARDVEVARTALMKYCNDGLYDRPSYATLISSAANSLEYPDEYMTIQGEDASGTIPQEVKDNLRIVLAADGHTIPASWNPDHYSCSC